MIQNFISPEGIYAEVREELKSYFNATAVDDAMFDKWTSRAMAKFRMSSKPIKEVFLPLDNFMSVLPDDFYSVRELWACEVHFSDPVRNPSSFYYRTDCRITPIFDKCNECFDGQDYQPCETPDKYKVTRKQTGHTIFEYRLNHLLRPGNVNARKFCNHDSPNISCRQEHEFDVDGCNILTTIREGGLHLIYYSTGEDEDGNILIPNNAYVQDFLMKNLKHKLFEQLSNQVTDETYNQIMNKLQMAKYERDSAYVSAEAELKRQGIWKIHDNIKKSKHRFDYYKRSLR